jgi:hypothetical protein
VLYEGSVNVGANVLLAVAFASHARPSCPTTFTTMNKLKAFFKANTHMTDSQLQSNSGSQTAGTLVEQRLPDDVIFEIAMNVNREAPVLMLNLILTVGLILSTLVCVL